MQRKQFYLVSGATAAIAIAWLAYGAMHLRNATAPDVEAAATRGHLAGAFPHVVARVQAPLSPSDPRMPVRLTRELLRAAMRTGELTIELADGTRYPVRVLREQAEPGDRVTFVGRVQTRLGLQSAVLTFGPDAVFGVIPKPDGFQFHVATTHGLVYLEPAGGLVPKLAGGGPGRPMDVLAPPAPAAPRGAGNALPHRPSPPAAATAPPARRAVAGDGSPVRIDVLVLYDAALASLRGSVSAAETEVTNLVAVANQAHLDSGSRVRLSLVGMREITLPIGTANEAALYAVTNDNVEGIGIGSLRDELSADLVAVVRPYVEGDPTCGISWLAAANMERLHVDPHWAYSVSAVGPLCGPYVFPHELGHSMGSQHDRQTASWTIDRITVYGAYPYSFGYRQDGPPSFATIMAYTEQWPWVGYFSNPASTACGASCGTAELADNVRSLNEMAPVIAAFRGAPGTVSILDADGLEPMAGQTGWFWVTIRHSGPIPQGGVHMQLVRTGGTATPGTDYDIQSPRPVDILDDNDALIPVFLTGDDDEEGDETIVLRLESVTGATVARGEAVATIVDDDPRPRLDGQVRFPEGMAAPATPFTIQARGIDGNPRVTTTVEVSPPDFRYSIPFPKNADISLNAFPPAPFAARQFDLGQLTGSLQADYPMTAGVTVSGRIVVPPGGPVPIFPLRVDFSESIDSYGRPVRHLEFADADGHYAEQVLPGAHVALRAYPDPPYQPFLAIGRYEYDVVQDITLSTLPSLVVWGRYDLTSEGPNTFSGAVSLSAPAPEGGVTLDYRSEGGTATPGEDYAPVSGRLVFAPGETEKTFEIQTYDDSRIEDDEYFYIVVDNVSGAMATTPRAQVIIPNDDFPPPALSISGESPASEGDAGTRNQVTLLVQLSAPPPPGGVYATWRTRDGTARAGQDYAGNGGNLYFGFGETQRWITVQTFGDARVENDEFFDVLVENIAGTTVANASVRITLPNDDTDDGRQR